MVRIAVTAAGGAPVCAFLDMLKYSELGARLIADPRTDGGYKVLVGSTPSHPLLFDDYSRHPQVLNHALNSTAAGAYQIIRGTWHGVAGELGLTDFSPVSQDRAAIQLIFERGALPSILAGDIAKAIVMCNPEWASLPGAAALLPDGTPQHENRMADLLLVYAEALEKYAQ
jgi:muramidase (phage lysozyme)